MNSSSVSAFLGAEPFAVAGASNDRSKYGNKVLRALLQNGKTAIPINPKADLVEGVKAYPDLKSIPEPIHGLCIITPPSVTEAVVREAVELGIRHIWMQPGAESEQAVQTAESAGASVIHSGPCILVALRYREA